jgi:hypothetical protein
MPGPSAFLTRTSSLMGSPHKRALARALRGSRSRVPAGGARDRADLERQLDATYEWLCAAQDNGGDGGVAAAFNLFDGRWSAPYPETTGYIIPSFLALAEARSDPAARERALRMADWETRVQMPDGAVLSGLLGATSGPAVFNTGQALFGWISALQASGEARYERSARAAASWLVQNQDADGAWRTNLSELTRGSSPSYNCRCAWALAYAAGALGEERLLEAARANCDWVLAQQNGAGWFAHAGFADGQVPLLHTIS